MLLFSLYKISKVKEPVKKEMYLQILGGKDMNIDFRKIVQEFDPEIADYTTEWELPLAPEPQEAEEKEPA